MILSPPVNPGVGCYEGGDMSNQGMSAETHIQRFIIRLVICLFVGLRLTLLVALITNYLPSFFAYIVNLPGFIYCHYLSSYGPAPTASENPFNSGEGLHCFLITLVLNIPYYTLLVYGVWWQLEGRGDKSQSNS
jgi:hypothetical protein